MRLIVFLAVLFGIPYLEFLVFAEVSVGIGTFNAILLTLLTAVFGVFIIKKEGIGVIGKMKANMHEGKSPVLEIFHGFLLLIAGFFFLLPGFITDTIALLFSVSFIRDIIAHLMVKNMKINFETSDTNGFKQSPFDNSSTIDGEFQDVNDETGPIEQQFLEDEEKSKKSSDDLENPNKDPKS